MRTTSVSTQTLATQAHAKTNEASTKASSASPTGASEQLAKVSPALAKAHQRIDAQAQVASSSLSVLGRFKSSLHELDTAAQGLSALTTDSPAQAIQSAVGKFVVAYNANVKAGQAVAADGVRSESGSARVQRELRTALTNAAGGSGGLAKLGVNLQKDGSLSFDAKVLGQAVLRNASGVATAWHGISKGLSDSTAKTLTADSRLNASLSHLGDQAIALRQQQSAVLDVAQQMAQSRNPPSSSRASALLAAYQNNA